MSAGPNNPDWLWRSNPKQYVSHEVGEAIFLFCRLSGTTHILNLVSMAMLDYLSAEPQTLKGLSEGFHAHLGVALEECPTGVARRIFDELDEAGLVQRVSQP